MPTFRDRIHERHGRLFVVSHAGKDNRNKHLWLCKCDCGNEKIVVSDNLSSRKSNSCGCLKKEFLAKKGNQFGLYENRQEAMLKIQYSHLKRRHLLKKLDGTVIDFKTFEEMSISACKYCGLAHSKEIEDRKDESKSKKRLSNEILSINGIDRLDNNKGYSKENCVPCCKYCNFAKHTMSEDDFYKWVKRVYEFNFK